MTLMHAGYLCTVERFAETRAELHRCFARRLPPPSKSWCRKGRSKHMVYQMRQPLACVNGHVLPKLLICHCLQAFRMLAPWWSAFSNPSWLRLVQLRIWMSVYLHIPFLQEACSQENIVAGRSQQNLDMRNIPTLCPGGTRLKAFQNFWKQWSNMQRLQKNSVCRWQTSPPAGAEQDHIANMAQPHIWHVHTFLDLLLNRFYLLLFVQVVQ